MNKCPHCEGPTIESDVVDYFEYGSGDDATTLYAVVTVISCNDCGLEFTDWRGEDARQAAVDRFLGVPPVEVELYINHDESMNFSITGRELQTLAEWQTEHN